MIVNGFYFLKAITTSLETIFYLYRIQIADNIKAKKLLKVITDNLYYKKLLNSHQLWIKFI